MSNYLEPFFRQALDLHRLAQHISKNTDAAKQGFPPYNIIVDNPEQPKRYMLELAVAGFSRDELSVKVTKNVGIPILVIEGMKNETDDKHYHHRGLTSRSFTREFTMSDNVKIDSVQLKDGILTVVLNTVKAKEDDTLIPIL